jgi:Na+/proline symporter
LYLAAEVLDIFLFKPLGIPYELGIVITIALIWVYTFKSGIKTIVWTDTLQTASILIAVGATVYFLRDDLNTTFGGLFDIVVSSDLFNFEGGKNGNTTSVWLSAFNGMLMALAMTGVDQDMMQKNLTCKTAKESGKNVMWFSIVLIPVNFVFLGLGILLYERYVGDGLHMATLDDGTITYLLKQAGEYVSIHPDQLYPTLADTGYFPTWLSATFLIGLVAAAYSSADSALTSLTTSFCLDILEKDDKKTRLFTHIGFSVLLVIVIIIFKAMNKDSIVWELYKWAGFTYGPLLGLFGFGILTKVKVLDKAIPVIAIASAVASFFIKDLFGLGFEILLVNALVTALGLFLFQERFFPQKSKELSGVLDSGM